MSPGPMDDESKFISTVIQNNHLLPEYVTGLLLSRNVELHFKKVDVRAAGHAVSISHRAKLSGGFGPWRASFSYGYGKSERSFNSELASDGMRITIPGAQVIGYFTQVTPQFPPVAV